MPRRTRKDASTIYMDHSVKIEKEDKIHENITVRKSKSLIEMNELNNLSENISLRSHQKHFRRENINELLEKPTKEEIIKNIQNKVRKFEDEEHFFLKVVNLSVLYEYMNKMLEELKSPEFHRFIKAIFKSSDEFLTVISENIHKKTQNIDEHTLLRCYFMVSDFKRNMGEYIENIE
jgi:uncharacterized protein (UPF0276 family)